MKLGSEATDWNLKLGCNAPVETAKPSWASRLLEAEGKIKEEIKRSRGREACFVEVVHAVCLHLAAIHAIARGSPTIVVLLGIEDVVESDTQGGILQT